MRQVLLFGIVLLAFVPTAHATTSVEQRDEKEADAWTFEYSLRGETSLLAADEASFAVGLDVVTGYAPQDSAAAPQFDLLQFLLAQGLTTAGPTAPEPSADLLGVAIAETDAVLDEGATAAATATATERGVEAAYAATVGNQQASGATSTPVLGDVPDRAGEAPPTAAPEAPPQAVPETADRDPQPNPMVATQGSAYAVPLGLGLPEALAAATAIATVSTGALLLVPGWRGALWRIMRRIGGLLLFSRISQSEILNHERRSELVEFVRQNPGERVEVARRALGFSNGSMHYHLRVLTMRDLVRVHKEGGFARLFLAGPKVHAVPYVPPQRRRFLDLVSAKPGLTQREAAIALGLSERMVSYHVRALTTQGYVTVQNEGARKRLYLRALVST